MMKHKIWEKTEQITWDETSPNGKLSLTGLSLIMQRVAVEHAEHLGFGFTETSKDNVSWVLFRLNLELKRLPEWQETVKVQTWPRAIEGRSAFREFRLFCETGEELCNATSEWMIINLTTRRPQRMDKFEHLAPYYTPEKAFDQSLPKLNSRAAFENLFTVNIRYSDLDMNGHTNARKYFDWLDDAIYKIHPEQEIRLLQMNYFSECKLDESVDIQYSPEDKITFRGLKKESERTAFLARIEF